MTVEELSTEFDVFYNNITSNQAPGLNGYEKSVFLTRAQSQLIQEHFLPYIAGSGFDVNQDNQYDFSSIINHTILTEVENGNKFDQRSILYALPSDWMLTLNEQLTVTKTDSAEPPNTHDYYYTVKPISYYEYDRLMSKPYQYPIKHQAWRLITNKQVVGQEKLPKETSSTCIIQDEAKIIVIFKNKFQTENIPLQIEFIFSEYDDIVYYLNNTLYINCYYSINQIVNTYMRTLYVSTGNFYRVEMSIKAYDFRGDEFDRTVPFGTMVVEEGTILRQWIKGYGLTLNMTIRSVDLEPIYGDSIELILNQDPTDVIEYRIRYVKKPIPIILEDLSDYDVSIEGRTSATTEEELNQLPEKFYKDILERAVTLAKIAWSGSTETITSMAAKSNQNNRQ